MTQPCPDLAMPLAMERAGGKDALDRPGIAVVSAPSDIAPSGPRRCAVGGTDRWR